jgi:hypothetical protein
VEEKQIYLSAIVLSQGFYYGQTSYLTNQEFLAIANVYNYFGDYELPYNDGFVSP